MTDQSPQPTIVIAFICLLVVGSVPTAPAQVCGNGIIEPPEECDDGAGFRLDGCAPDCTYEHVQRITLLELAAGISPAICTPRSNAFGSVFSALGLAGVNAQLASAIGDGTLNQLMQLVELDDPAAAADADLELGMATAALDPRGATSDLDGWYLADAGSLDSDDLPAVRLPGSITTRELVAGPTRISVAFLDGNLTLRDAFITAQVGPSTSEPAPPPVQLAAGFEAFEVLDATDGNHGLCGNLTVETISMLPLPENFAAGGTNECSGSCTGSRSYTWCGPDNPVGPGCNSMLDMLVGGCAVAPPFCLPVITPTQPDVGTGGQPPHVLVADPTTGKVTVAEPEDAYSTWLELSSQRVHLSNHLGGIFADGFEDGTTGAWSGGSL